MTLSADTTLQPCMLKPSFVLTCAIDRVQAAGRAGGTCNNLRRDWSVHTPTSFVVGLMLRLMSVLVLVVIWKVMGMEMGWR